ncbi:MAG: DUF554 domain-containing protein [Treponema sp.]|nr:DUF554 domain-containing protein [Treponema sp.]
MNAVLVNCSTVLLGSFIGLMFARKISQKITDSIQLACGLVSLIMGIQMAFKYQNVVYLALALILGGILGTLLDIDGKILGAGKKLEKVFIKNSSSEKNFAYAFLNASVLFCVGAMAIIGSFKAGIEHDYSIIFLKSVLDGFISIGFAAAMGAGTAFSVIAIFLYQGALTLLAVVIEPYVSEQMIAEITGSGGALIVFIGINLMGLKNVITANFLPAVLFRVIFVLCEPVVIRAYESITGKETEVQKTEINRETSPEGQLKESLTETAANTINLLNKMLKTQSE